MLGISAINLEDISCFYLGTKPHTILTEGLNPSNTCPPHPPKTEKRELWRQIVHCGPKTAYKATILGQELKSIA